MSTKPRIRPTREQLAANLFRMARTVQAIERSDHKDQTAWERLHAVVPQLAELLAAVVEQKKETGR